MPALVRARQVSHKSAIGQKAETNSSLLEWATLLFPAAWFSWEKGNAAETEMLADMSMRARALILGQNHEDTLWSRDLVARAYSLNGRFDTAEELHTKVADMRMKELGGDHIDTI